MAPRASQWDSEASQTELASLLAAKVVGAASKFPEIETTNTDRASLDGARLEISVLANKVAKMVASLAEEVSAAARFAVAVATFRAPARADGTGLIYSVSSIFLYN